LAAYPLLDLWLNHIGATARGRSIIVQEQEGSKSPTAQSSPNTESASTNKSLVQVSDPTPSDLQVESLQKRLTRAQDELLEERFLWFAFSGTLFLVLTFMAAGAVAGGVVALLFIAMLLVLSRRWGFEDLWEALHAASNLLKKDGGDEAA
jgi:hypothetical protein